MLNPFEYIIKIVTIVAIAQFFVTVNAGVVKRRRELLDATITTTTTLVTPTFSNYSSEHTSTESNNITITNLSSDNEDQVLAENPLINKINETNRVNNNTEFHDESLNRRKTRVFEEYETLSENEMLANSSTETSIIEMIESDTPKSIPDNNQNLLKSDENSMIEANTTNLEGTKNTENLPQENTLNFDSVLSFITSGNASESEQENTTTQAMSPDLINSTHLMAHSIPTIIPSTTMETMSVTENESIPNISTTTSSNDIHDIGDESNKPTSLTVESNDNKVINSNDIHLLNQDNHPLNPEKRPKFINENSTNTNQLNLPDAAEVWSLAGMKSVSKHGFDRNTVSDFVQNNKKLEHAEQTYLMNSVMGNNSEKNLLDWTQIMINGGLNETKETTTEQEINATTAVVPTNDEEKVTEGTTTPTTLRLSTEIINNDTANNTFQDRDKLATDPTEYTTESGEFTTEQLTTAAATTTVGNVMQLGSELNSDLKTDSSSNPEKEYYFSTTVQPESTTSMFAIFPQDNDDKKAIDISVVVSTPNASLYDHLENKRESNTTQTTNSNYIEESEEHGTTTTTTMETSETTNSVTELAANSVTELTTLAVERAETSIPLSEASITMTTTATTSTPIANEEAVTFTAEGLPENSFSTNLQSPPPPASNNDVRPTTNTTNNQKSYNNENNANSNDGDGDGGADNEGSTYEFPLNETTTVFSTPGTAAVSTTTVSEQPFTERSEVSVSSSSSSFSTTTATTLATEFTVHTTNSGTENPNKSAEVNNTTVSELGSDITADISTPTTTIYYKTLEEDNRRETTTTTTTTSSENELIISTPSITTVVSPISTLPIGLEGGELEETTKEPTQNSTISTHIKEPISSVETESESPIETNIINPSETNTSSTSKPAESTPNSLIEPKDNEEMIPQTHSTSTMENLPSITTEEDPLISLLDDFTSTSETPKSTLSTKDATEEDYILTSTTEVTYSTIAPPITTAEPSTTPIAYDTTDGNISSSHVLTTMLPKTHFNPEFADPNLHSETTETPETDVNVIIAISFSVIGIIALILLVAFLYVMRKRQKQMSYGQRCRPVSLDAYSMENISVYNSVRRKGALRSSKRSYGNVAFDDPSLRHNILSPSELAKFLERRSNVYEEFRDIPQIIARADEVPRGCEDKNRYANVIPLPETRVILQQQNGDEKTEYINANYIRGPKDSPNYYIACQAPLENTVADFWRMIWEQQSRVIVQATDIIENGVDKCAEYLPPSVTLDNHTTYGDFQIILKNREVKDKYAISTIIMKNTITESSREITHYWYKWPETGVPSDEASIIAMLLEIRSSLKSYAVEQANEFKEKSSAIKKTASMIGVEDNGDTSDRSKQTNENGEYYDPNTNMEINSNLSSDKLKSSAVNNQGPLTVHCSPGTGRTGTIIACDIAIRNLETPKRNIDIPQIVYYVRRGRASSVQTKEQYEFIYRVANMYAIKISNFSGEN